MGRHASPARHRAEKLGRQKSSGSHRGERRRSARRPFAITGAVAPMVIGAGVVTSAAVAVGTASGLADEAGPIVANEVAMSDVADVAAAPARPEEVSRSGSRLRIAPPVTLSLKPPVKKPAPPEPPKPAWLQSCADAPTSLDYPNGRIPTEALCDLPAGDGHLRADAAVAYADLEAAYAKRFGDTVCITDSYRSLDAQYRVAAAKPGLAARPGTSNHGWGVALDLCGGIESSWSEQHEWFLANAPKFGWQLPSWARPGGSRPEPWHWEFVKG